MVSQRLPPPKVELPESALFSLKNHQRETLLALASLGEASAESVALSAGKARANTSLILNQLERQGYLERFRKGREVVFRIKEGKVGQ